MKILGFDITRTKKEDDEQRGLNYVSSCCADALTFNPLRCEAPSMSLSAVFRAVELISDSIAVLPIKVKGTASKHDDEVQHPLTQVFDDRNREMSTYTLMKLLIESVILNGNGFCLINRASDGTPISLRYVPSGWVTINYNELKPDSLTYTVNGIKGRIEPINMIHLVKNSRDGIHGISLLTYAARTIGLAQQAEANCRDFFEHGRNLAGVLKVDGQLKDDQRQQIHNSWNKAYCNGGSGLAIIQGNMSYQSIQLSSKDAQLLETRQFNVNDIARFFGISPVLLGDLTHSSYSTIEASQLEFLTHTLLPYIQMVEAEFNRKLVKKSEANTIRIDLDETALMKTDKQAEANYYKTLLENGVLCINEVRKQLGYNEIEGGDKHIIAYTDIKQNTINNDGQGEGNKND